MYWEVAKMMRRRSEEWKLPDWRKKGVSDVEEFWIESEKTVSVSACTMTHLSKPSPQLNNKQLWRILFAPNLLLKNGTPLVELVIVIIFFFLLFFLIHVNFFIMCGTQITWPWLAFTPGVRNWVCNLGPREF